MITTIESLLDKELAMVRGNGDVCSDIFGNQKSKILEDRICSLDPSGKSWFRMGQPPPPPWRNAVPPPR